MFLFNLLGEGRALFPCTVSLSHCSSEGRWQCGWIEKSSALRKIFSVYILIPWWSCFSWRDSEVCIMLVSYCANLCQSWFLFHLALCIQGQLLGICLWRDLWCQGEIERKIDLGSKTGNQEEGWESGSVRGIVLESGPVNNSFRCGRVYIFWIIFTCYTFVTLFCSTQMCFSQISESGGGGVRCVHQRDFKSFPLMFLVYANSKKKTQRKGTSFGVLIVLFLARTFELKSSPVGKKWWDPP